VREVPVAWRWWVKLGNPPARGARLRALARPISDFAYAGYGLARFGRAGGHYEHLLRIRNLLGMRKEIYVFKTMP